MNISLGCPWDPTHYAAGQSPLSQAVNQLVHSGVVVVVSAGNGGGGRSQTGDEISVLGSITEPAHAEDCIAVGSTHRDAPHAFGVSWTSSRGPTLDGRLKPDVVTCDLIMPRSDGVDFIQKQMAIQPVPIVVVSISSEASERVLNALDAGAVDFVQNTSGLLNGSLV